MTLLKIAQWLMIIGIVITLIGLAVIFTVGGVDLDPAALSQEVLIQAALGALVLILGVIILLPGVFIYAIVPMFRRDLAEYRFGGYLSILSLLIVAIILSLVGSLIVALPGLFSPASPLQLFNMQGQATVEGLVLMVVIQAVVFTGLVYLRVVRPGVLSWQQIGFTTRSLPRDIALGFGGAVAAIIVSAVIGLILQQFGVLQTQSEEFSVVRGASFPQLAAVLFAAVIVAPMSEETFFRGYAFTGSRLQRGAVVAFLFTSIVFAGIHFNGPATLPIFAMGLILAGLRFYGGSLYSAMVAHGLNNLLAITVLFMGIQ